MRIFDVDSIGTGEHAGVAEHLVPDETVHLAFRAATTTIIFTDRRIVTLQLHMLLNERLEASSFSYRSMRQFSLLQGTDGESRSEMKIWIGAESNPIHLRANQGTNLSGLQQLLAGKLH